MFSAIVRCVYDRRCHSLYALLLSAKVSASSLLPPRICLDVDHLEMPMIHNIMKLEHMQRLLIDIYSAGTPLG